MPDPESRAARRGGSAGTVIGLSVLGLAAGFLIVGASTYPGRWFPPSRQGPWLVTFPVLGSPDLPSWLAHAVYFGGIALLCGAWLVLVRFVRVRPRFPWWAVMAVFALWSVPFALGPPVASEDVLIYIGAGQLVDRHVDPYDVGVAALGPEPVVQASSSFWTEAPQPYGPLYLKVAALAHRPGASWQSTAVILRLFGLGCLALLAWPLAVLARQVAHPPGLALATVLCSPLVLLHLVGGIHNEALMLLLLAGGVALGLAGFARPGGVHCHALVLSGAMVCGAATAVKLPALLGAAVLGWLWAGKEASIARRVGGLTAATLIAAGTAVAISFATGLGLGWSENLDVPQRAYTLLSPFTALAAVISGASGVPELAMSSALSILRPVGAVLGVAAASLCLVFATRLGPHAALGLALAALAISTPVVWPWYFTWGLVFLAVRPLAPPVQIALVALNFAVTPLGPPLLDLRGHYWTNALLVTIIGLVAAVLVARRVRGFSQLAQA